MNYLSWNEETITDFSPESVSAMYERGFVFTRLGRGVMKQTRSARIDLKKFSLTSENRRILKKMEGIHFESDEPLPVETYRWQTAKMGKDFYETKFGPGIMSTQKIKEMLTDLKSSNFNFLYTYSSNKEPILPFPDVSHIYGYAIVYRNRHMVHYSYPFYNLKKSAKDMGLGMMTMAVREAKASGLKYVYLGSLQRPSDTYKLQFEGLEWFDGKEWKTDLEEAKDILTKSN